MNEREVQCPAFCASVALAMIAHIEQSPISANISEQRKVLCHVGGGGLAGITSELLSLKNPYALP